MGTPEQALGWLPLDWDWLWNMNFHACSYSYMYLFSYIIISIYSVICTYNKKMVEIVHNNSNHTLSCTSGSTPFSRMSENCVMLASPPRHISNNLRSWPIYKRKGNSVVNIYLLKQSQLTYHLDLIVKYDIVNKYLDNIFLLEELGAYRELIHNGGKD